MVRIAIDAMGGDFAPQEQVKGCTLALARDKDLYLILCGDETAIKAELAKYQYDASRLEIVHTTEVIEMNDIPTKAVKAKKDSSTVVAFRLVKEGKADGVVCSGSTGAVLVCGTTMLFRIKGISRPALCPVLPNGKGKKTFLCDCGANLECKSVNLRDFAIMATAFAQACYGMERPTVGLLNNGTEDHKGTLLQQETNALLKDVSCINYAGNVEGRALMSGEVDIVVSDGFTGNIAMKAVEGCGKAVGSSLKRGFGKNLFNKLRYLVVKDIVGGIKDSLDHEKVGGAMLLGVPYVVVKGHGNSKANGFSVCIKQAADAVRGDMVGKIQTMVSKLVEEERVAEEAKKASEAVANEGNE